MQYTGAGYYQIAQDSSTIGSIITGGLNGGEPATPVTFDEVAVNTFYSGFPAFSQSETATIPGLSLGDGGALAGKAQMTLRTRSTSSPATISSIPPI